MKKFFTILLSCLLIISFTACSSTETSSAKAKTDYTLKEVEKKVNDEVKAHNNSKDTKNGKKVEECKFGKSILGIPNSYSFTSKDNTIMLTIVYEEKDGAKLISGMTLTCDSENNQVPDSFSVYESAIITLIQPELSSEELLDLNAKLAPYDNAGTAQKKEVKVNNITYFSSADSSENVIDFSVSISHSEK